MKLSRAAIHALASEYVLGTLRGAARRRFERMAREDRAVADTVRKWEDAMTPLAGWVEPVAPPARVWREIESRTTTARAPARAPSWWRPFGLVAGGLATVLLAFFVFLSGAPRGDPVFVAVLTASDQVPRVVVSMHDPDLLRVRVVKPWSNMERQSLELWALPKDGKPRSLGLVHNAPGDTMIRVSASDPRVQGMNALAVSMEPMGGSPTGQPTGAVVCAGPIAPVKATRA